MHDGNKNLIKKQQKIKREVRGKKEEKKMLVKIFSATTLIGLKSLS